MRLEAPIFNYTSEVRGKSTKSYVKLDGSYMFRSTTIIRELAIEPG